LLLILLSLRVRAYFNVPTGTDVLGDLKSVLEGLVPVLEDSSKHG